MTTTYNSLVEHASAISLTDLDLAKRQALELIDHFKYREKIPMFTARIHKCRTCDQVQKIAWDLVLVGDNLKVIK